MLDRVALARRSLQLNAVVVLRRNRIRQIVFGSALGHPDALRISVSASKAPALLKVANGSWVIKRKSKVVSIALRRRLPHVWSNVVVLKEILALQRERPSASRRSLYRLFVIKIGKQSKLTSADAFDNPLYKIRNARNKRWRRSKSCKSYRIVVAELERRRSKPCRPCPKTRCVKSDASDRLLRIRLDCTDISVDATLQLVDVVPSKSSDLIDNNHVERLGSKDVVLYRQVNRLA